MRRAVVWGMLRSSQDHPPRDHHSFAEHDDILQAIADRDPVASEALMRRHIGTVTRKMLGFEIL